MNNLTNIEVIEKIAGLRNCPSCGGNGFFELFGYTLSGYPDVTLTVCDVCQGTGHEVKP